MNCPVLTEEDSTATHVGLGTGLNTGRERYDPLTLWMRLRVALSLGYTLS